MALIIFISLVTIVMGGIAFAIYHIKRLSLYRAAEKFPGDKTLPLIGNAHQFMGKPERYVNKVMELANQYSSPCRFWLGHKLYIVITDPEQIKQVLFSPKTVAKAEIYDVVHPFVGNGLVTAPASIWRIHRKLIGPTFNTNIIESFISIFADQSNILTKVLEAEAGGNEFEIYDYIARCTLDIILETALDVPGTSQEKRKSYYIDMVEAMAEALFTRMTNVLLHPDIIYYLTPYGTAQTKCIEYLHKFTDDLIQKKRVQLSDSLHLQNAERTVTSKPRKVFLDYLMELVDEGIKFTEQDLRDEVNTMIFAGQDTSAAINTFIILMLANFPDIQEKCYDELCTIFGDKINDNTRITRDDVRQMNYLERVIKETLRLFPVAPLFARHVADDLNIGDYTLPKGSTAFILVGNLHRRPDIWTDSLEFNPDRFLPHEVAKRHPYSFVPFGGGPRNCIGAQFAMISIKILIATILRKYIIQKDLKQKIEDIKFTVHLVIKPVEPIKVKLIKR